MQTTILLFDQLADSTGHSTITVHGLTDSDSLIQYLHNQYPALVASKCIMAVDKKMIRENTPLSMGTTVALLPPFSGE